MSGASVQPSALTGAQPAKPPPVLQPGVQLGVQPSMQAGMQPRREGMPLRPLPKPLPLKPKRVRGGMKYEGMLDATPPPAGLWAAQRWMRLVESVADGESLRDGLEYAKQGQTRRWVVLPGRIEASIQGRAPRPFTTVLRVQMFSPENWERVIAGLSEGAAYAAKLLSGELPTNIEEAFAPAGLRLFPNEASDVVVSCSCEGCDVAGGMPPGMGIGPGQVQGSFSNRGFGSPQVKTPEAASGGGVITGQTPQDVASAQTTNQTTPAAISAKVTPVYNSTTPTFEAPVKPANGWCLHVCCVAQLLAEALATKPFLLFAMRGLDGDEILERLRQRRAVVGTATGATPVYQQRVQGVSDIESASIDSISGSFWEAGTGLDNLDIPMGPPEVSHPLLRRLGASPFPNGAFPMVGLLASCYETITENVLRVAEGEEGIPEDSSAAEDESNSDDDESDADENE